MRATTFHYVANAYSRVYASPKNIVKGIMDICVNPIYEPI